MENEVEGDYISDLQLVAINMGITNNKNVEKDLKK